MTGLGQVQIEPVVAGQRWRMEVELRSVNARYLDLQIRPALSAALEHQVSAQLSKVLGRGRVHLQIQAQIVACERDATQHRAAVEPEELQALCQALTQVRATAAKAGVELAPPDTLSLWRAAKLQAQALHGAAEELGPWEHQEGQDALGTALRKACHDLVQMREREGVALCQHMRDELDGLAAALMQIQTLRQELEPQLLERLQQRVHKLLEGAVPSASTSVDKGRLAQELAILLAKADVEEERIRIHAFLAQAREILDEAPECGQGKRLAFICQELSREWSTLGAKFPHPKAGTVLIAAKTHVERLREQAQNVE